MLAQMMEQAKKYPLRDYQLAYPYKPLFDCVREIVSGITNKSRD